MRSLPSLMSAALDCVRTPDQARAAGVATPAFEGLRGARPCVRLALNAFSVRPGDPVAAQACSHERFAQE